MEIFLLTFLCVNIAFRARARGLKPLPWVVMTIVSSFAAMFLGAIVIFLTWLNKYGSSQKDLEHIQEMMKSGELVPNNWNLLFVFICLIGGYLFVRYRQDKYPKIEKNNGQDDLPS
jgi:hypothetical protein